MNERRYTLDEAKRELAKQSCRLHGHDFQVEVRAGGDPERILCERCGRVWPVGDAK